MITVQTPGFYDMKMADYLADPAPEPSLSSKVVGALWKQTPQKARQLHPKLNPASLDTTPRADIGSAVHALIHGGLPVLYGDWKDWRTDASKAFRDATRAEQAIPLLEKDRIGVEAAATAGKMALAELGTGKHEQTMVWQHNGVWLRGRADFLTDGAVQIEGMADPAFLDIDTKTVDDADEVSWIKSTLYGSDSLDVQITMRHLGHIALGQPRRMGWLLQEYEHPYDNVIVLASDEVIDLALRKINHATPLWRRCLDTNKWPGKRRKAVWAVPPPWAAWELENRGIA